MRVAIVALAVFTAAIPMAQSADAETLFLRGKVMREDGSPPGKSVSIERLCVGRDAVIVATTNKMGDYLWRTEGDGLGLDIYFNSTSASTAMLNVDAQSTTFARPVAGLGRCVLRASLPGHNSTTIELQDKDVIKSPQLPLLRISPKRPGVDVLVDTSMEVPRRVSSAWEKAQKAMNARDWNAARERLLEATAIDPKFTTGWLMLGLTDHQLKLYSEARDAYTHAVALNPKSLQNRVLLLRATMECQGWAEAVEIAGAIIEDDLKRTQLEPYLNQAIALYHLGEFERAQNRINDLLRLDKSRQFPRAEYALGIVLEARNQLDVAREHMTRYLELQPNASDVAAVRERIANLGKTRAPAEAEIDSGNITADNPGEVAIPGGLKAFAAIARLETEPVYENFFLDYCRKLLHETSPYTGVHIPAYTEQLQAYMAAVSELSAAGPTRDDDSVLVTLSLRDAAERKKTARLLRLIGWRLIESGSSPVVELGDQPEDGIRHAIPSALGIDEIAMRDALNDGREFNVEIRSDNARMVGGIRWAAVLKDIPPYPGGMADVFSRDLRFAKAYAGLGGMSVESALGLLNSVGVRQLVTLYAGVLERCSGTLTSSGGRTSVPGGKEAQPVWAKLAGVDPSNPAAFSRSLITKDGGRLAVFYSVLSQVDERHQRYFLADESRARRFYEWYRDSDLRNIESRMPNLWRGDLFAKLPIDDAGALRFPGGRGVWIKSSGADDESLLRSERLEAFIPVALLEETRGAPLDAASATLLSSHYPEWRSLFPYFEKLPALRAAELESLWAFTQAAAARPEAARNSLMAEWHSLMKLIALGAQSGSLEPATAAQAFGRVCRTLAGPNASEGALAELREIAGGAGTLDEAVTSRLLRLDPPHRASFDRVRAMINSPALQSAIATPALAPAALTGAVYAAVLEPDCLLLAEDPEIFGRHRFVAPVDAKIRSPFSPTELFPTVESTPSYLSGGFMTLEEVSRNMARYRSPSEQAAKPAVSNAPAAQPAPDRNGAVENAEAVFRANGRLVEASVTVTDNRGRYSDDIPLAEFTLLDDGHPVSITSFENQASAVSLALLFDATGSMQNALPSLKSAALKLIGELRPIDSVAVYSFNLSVTELQAFTTDKKAAERAVLRAHAEKATALYDALVRVNRDLAGRPGKKAVVVFTDGADNQSLLTASIAIARAKAAAAPIYTIAQGEALRDYKLLAQLTGVSKSTGGLSFGIHEPSEIMKVFESVSRDLQHGYLLTFQPPADHDPGWHKLTVALRAARGRTVRARQGYSLE